MSRLPESLESLAQQLQQYALTIGVTAVAAVNSAPASAQAAQNPDSLKPDSVPQEVNKHGGHNQPLPPIIERDMRRNTVYNNVLRCSGRLLRNHRGEIVGEVVAEHCSLTDKSSERIQGDDGKTYIVQPKPVVAKTGARQDGFKTAAVMTEFVVPAKTDENHDLVIAVASGHTPKEALAVDKAQALPLDQLTKMRVGQDVYAAGKPDYQPKNGGSKDRQAFTLKLLGFGRADTVEKLALDVLWTSVNSTNEGATTSYGISGGVLTALVKGKVRTIGTASIFHDLKGDVPYGGTTPPTAGGFVPKLKGHNATAVTGFTYNRPPRQERQILHSVRSTAEIPGYISPEQAQINARIAFNNPDIPKTVLGGSALSVATPRGGNPLVKESVVFRDAKHNQTVIAWTDAQDPDHIHTEFVSDRNLGNVLIYGLAPGVVPSFVSTAGPLTYHEAQPVIISDPPLPTPAPVTPVTRAQTRQINKGGGLDSAPIGDQGTFSDASGLEGIGAILTEQFDYSNGYYSFTVDAKTNQLLITQNSIK